VNPIHKTYINQYNPIENLLSSKFLKHEREWPLTTLAGKLFQSFITQCENELSLTFVQALGLQSFKL